MLGHCAPSDQQKPVICWAAETGLRDHVTRRSYSPLGRAPFLRATTQGFGGNMISAITNRGHLAFMVFRGKFDGRRFVQFMQRLLRQFCRRVYPIVDCHPVHRSVLAKQFVETHNQKRHLIRMLGYCLELNSDDALNQGVESKQLGKNRPGKSAGLMTGVSVGQVFNPVAAG